MIFDAFDWQEHLFVVYAKHAWDISKKYDLRNSYYIEGFDDNYFMKLIDKSAQIIVHCLYTPDLTSFLFQNQRLLNKVNWKLWGGDLYLYKQVGSVSNSEINEVKRRTIIKNVAYITSPVEDEFRHVLDVYGGNAQYKFAFYPLSKDFSEFKLAKSPHDDQIVRILLGNSGYPTNNHLKAFSFLSKFRNENLEIYCPLSYGDKDYIKKVCTKGTQIFGKKFIPLLDFIRFDEYINILNTMDVAVMNHDRQQGLGNILMLLYLRKKIYIQPDTTTYKCLSRFGISLYDIKEIKRNKLSDFVKYPNDDAKSNSEIIEATYSKTNCIRSWQAIFNGAIQRENKSDKRSCTVQYNQRTNISLPRKILFVNHSVAPYELSGTPISTLNHAFGMQSKGIDVAVLISSDKIKLSDEPVTERIGDILVYMAPRFDKDEAFLGAINQADLYQYLRCVEKIVEQFDPDIIHINDFVHMPIEIFEVFKKKRCLIVRSVCNDEELCHRQYPVVSTSLKGKLCSGPDTPEKCTDCYFIDNVKFPSISGSIHGKNITEKIIQRFSEVQHLYKDLVDSAIFTTQEFKNHFTNFIKIPQEKIKVVPRGFQFDFKRSNKPLCLTGDIVRFAFVGQVASNKGADVLLKAFEGMSKHGGFRLYIFGDIGNQEYLKWIRRLEKEFPTKIKYEGIFFMKDLGCIAQEIDVVIIPTYFDTYNRVIREMLYFGIPVITTDFYGSTIIRDGFNGLKIPIGDYKALEDCMSRIISKPELVAELSRGAINTRIPTLDEEIDELLIVYKEARSSREQTTGLFPVNTFFDTNQKLSTLNDINKPISSEANNLELGIGERIKIVELEKKLSEIYSSRGWKLLAKYYKARDLVLWRKKMLLFRLRKMFRK
jgi:glycosyltransferase involved in cell wall biosynthesis